MQHSMLFENKKYLLVSEYNKGNFFICWREGYALNGTWACLLVPLSVRGCCFKKVHIEGIKIYLMVTGCLR